MGPGVDPPVRVATYCANDPACFVGQREWARSARAGTFLAYDPARGATVPGCAARRCFGTACNCDPGEACVDTVESAPVGAACGLYAGGTCISQALAESIFEHAPADLLACCADGCIAGERCDAGWMRGGNRLAYERMEAVCAGSACVCGDGVCCSSELRSCSEDCAPPVCDVGGTCAPVVCGDGRCDPFEDAVRCAADCALGCGDGLCDATETAAECVTDCQEACGDGWCSAAERQGGGCAADCADRCPDAPSFTRVYRFCGDGVCDAVSTCDYQEPESCMTCPRDCGACTWELVESYSGDALEGHPTDVWAAGAAEVYVIMREGDLYRYDGVGWRRQHRLGSLAPPWRWHLFVPTGRSELYAYGVNGVVRIDGVHATPLPDLGAEVFGLWGDGGPLFATTADGVFRYQDGAWIPETTAGSAGFAPVLRNLWGSAPDQLIAAPCALEAVQRHDGVRWWWERTVFGEVPCTLWGSAPDDIHAVGDAPDTVGRRASAVHFDGVAWRNVSPGSGVPPFVDVWGAARDDVFALTRTGALWHYDGAAWTERAPAPFFEGSDFRVHALHGAAADVVYAVAEYAVRDATESAVVLHFDGSRWDHHPTTLRTGTIGDVWAESPSSLLAVSGNDLMRFDDEGRLLDVSQPLPAFGRYSWALWGSSPTDVYWAGMVFERGGTFGVPTSFAAHFDGVAWTEDPFLSGLQIQAFASGAAGGFAATYSGGLVHDGSGWSFLAPPGTVGWDGLSGVWASPAGEVVFSKTFMTRALLSCATRCTDPSQYTSYPAPDTIRTLWGSSVGDIWGARDRVSFINEVHHFDGVAWTLVPMVGGDQAVHDGFSSSATESWMAGDEGSIWTFDGASWVMDRGDFRRPGSSTCFSLPALRRVGDTLFAFGSDQMIVRRSLR